MVIISRCRCGASACGCFLQAGTGVTVSGNGSAGDPFIVSSAGGGAQFIDDLLDVDTVTAPPASGNVLQWDGAQWVPAVGGGGGGAYVAGAGLVEGPVGTFGVGAGQGVTVDADTVSADLTFLDARYGAATSDVVVSTSAPTTGALDLLWSNNAGLTGTPTPGPTSPLAPTFVRDAGTGTYFRATPAVMDDLRDVDTRTTAPAIGQTLHWDGVNWVPTTPATGAPEVHVGGAAPTTGAADLLWSNTAGPPGSATPGPTSPLAPTFVRDGATGTYYRATPAVVDDLRDVDTTTVAPVIGQSLTWNGTNWVPGAGGGGAQYIDQLLDVDTSTVPPVDGHTLVWQSTQWVPAIRLREVVQATAPAGARQLRWIEIS